MEHSNPLSSHPPQEQGASERSTTPRQEAARETTVAIGSPARPVEVDAYDDQRRAPPLAGLDQAASEQRPLPQVPGLRLLRFLGGGGMGDVYEAEDSIRRVAVKMIRNKALSPEMLERFRREAAALAELEHPHIVPIYHAGSCAEGPYFTMRLCPGGSLAQHQAAYQANPRQAVVLLLKVVEAVAFLHEKNKVHRDLKPHNILLDELGEPRVSDFGLVKTLAGELEETVLLPADEARATEPASATWLTQAGALMGTAAYMAPEQTRDARGSTPQSDLWALGVILYELLVGQRPFRASERDQLIEQIQNIPPPSPRSLRPGFDAELERIILKCLHKEPSRRYQSALDLARDLRRWLQRSRRRRALLALSVGAVLLLAGVFLLGPRAAPSRGEQLDRARTQLLQGQGVTLIGDTGEPLIPARIAVQDAESFGRPGGDQRFTLDAAGTTLWELLDDPGTESYRLRVEVRINHVADVGRSAGIYLAQRRVDLPEGAWHFLLEYRFAEAVPEPPAAATPEAAKEPGPAKELKVPLIRPKPGDGKWEVRLHAARFTDKGDANETLKKGPVKARPQAEDDPWRLLEVEATPATYRFFWEGELVYTLERPLPESSLKDLQRWLTRPLVPPPDFSPRGGLGLYVQRGSASFRAFRIEPLFRP